MMLPALPKSLGRLSDVFISALGAISGKHNRLALPSVKSACVIMVDGLGSVNLRNRAGHAPRLLAALERDGSIQVGFPSTTATSLSSFSTGDRAGKHGMVGYQIYDRSASEQVNLLTGISSRADAAKWQKSKTVSELAKEQSIDCFFVGAAEYENSGFTMATMPAAKYQPGKSIQDRFDAALNILQTKKRSLVYLYIPELDMKAHQFGAKSGEWVEKLEELESELAKFRAKLPESVGVLLTADHGIIDVDHSNHIYLDEFELPELLAVGGDPRVLYLYFENPPTSAFASTLQDQLGSRVFVANNQQLVEAGWFAEVEEFARDRMPDIFLISIGEVALYHRDFAKPKSLKMIGQHGSISDQELTVPLLRFGAFEKRD
jgi:predicted AlkP superfamily pyrophosphatase or phosphodiesterase